MLNYDTLQLIRSFTPLRIWNAIQIWVSYQISKWLHKNKHKGYPIAISIEPTTYCNLRCPECPSGLRNFTRPTGNLSMETFSKIIDELHQKTAYLILYFQGEPYLNPQFNAMVKYAREKKMYVATSTNAHYLTPENAQKIIDSGLNRLIISIDGTTQQTYQQYRIGGNLNIVIEGIKNLIQAKKNNKAKHPYVILQFIVFKHNEHQINEIKQLAKKWQVDALQLKTAQIYNFENGSPLIPENEKYRRYTQDKTGKFVIKNKFFNHCWKLWHSCVFTWDGKVLPCCFDKDAQYEMGNIQNQSFKDIWKNQKYNAFRRQILVGRSTIEMCKNCTEGTKTSLKFE
ncbi:MAG: SPASM domain-containing protein [Bacteroidia bacterium]|nr:SPASM domain-containing protein [Bacteroidia bacterium]MDW8345862.1 radical SAM/SPASM domain-containing protein [Bacteroidia bacterium]